MKALPPDLADARRQGALKALRTGDFAPLSMDGQALPIFATLDGTQVAVLSLDMYRRLMLAALNGPTLTAGTSQAAVGPPLGLSTIERDPEIADFLRCRFRGGVTVAQIRDACRSRFGEERTPSHSRIQRFREALKRVR